MLVMDHSGSMAATDVQPTRLAAAEQAPRTRSSTSCRPSVLVGAIAFSSAPDAVQAPVANHAAARAIVDAEVANGSTATGDALQLALQLLRGADKKHPPSAIVLLSDGAANAGVDVATVARQAAQDRIPIDTVALGTPNGVLPSPDPFQPPVAVPPDPQLMQEIAQLSGGRSFNAQSADELSSIYKQPRPSARHRDPQARHHGRVRDRRRRLPAAGRGGVDPLVRAPPLTLGRSGPVRAANIPGMDVIEAPFRSAVDRRSASDRATSATSSARWERSRATTSGRAGRCAGAL